MTRRQPEPITTPGAHSRGTAGAAYDAQHYNNAAQLAATQPPDIDPSLYDADWYQQHDQALTQSVLTWLREDTTRRVAWPITVPNRDRDLANHLDDNLPYPMGIELAGVLIRAASAAVMTRRLHEQRTARHAPTAMPSPKPAAPRDARRQTLRPARRDNP